MNPLDKREWDLMHTIEIKVYKEKTTGKRAPERYKRVVFRDGEEYYKDQMPLKMFCAASDPIRSLDKYLSGLKEHKSTKDTRRDRGYFISFFQEIRRKLVCKGP